MDTLPIINSSTGIQKLPEEMVRHIFSYLTDDEIVWRAGLTCKTLMEYASRSVKTIELPRTSDKEALSILNQVLKEDEFSNWIRHIVIVGSRSKKLLDQGLSELEGKNKIKFDTPIRTNFFVYNVALNLFQINEFY